jgi:hypothetical protein
MITNRTFLKAKHWQIFLFSFALPILFQIILIIYLKDKLVFGSHDRAEGIKEMFHGLTFTSIIILSCVFGWYWSIVDCTSFSIRIAGLPVKTVFRAVFVIVCICIAVIFFHWGFHVNKISRLMSMNSSNPAQLSFGIRDYIIPFLYLFAIGYVYLTYWVAKTIKLLELQREVRFSEFIREFFLIWFFPIGIWFIQPKINRWFEE